MWRRKRNPRALLVGMPTGAATVEDSTEVPQKIKNRATLWLSNSTIGYLLPANEIIRCWCLPDLFPFSATPPRYHPCCCEWQVFIIFCGWEILQCVHLLPFPYPFIHQWTLGCFHVLVIVNNAAMNMGGHLSFWINVFIFRE